MVALLSSPKGFGEVMQTVETWLEEEGFSYAQAKGTQAGNTLFNYVVTLPSGTKMNIFQPSNRKDSICVSTALSFSDKQLKTLRQKSKIERDEILSEMRYKLAPLDVEFRFENGELTRRIVILHPIYYDALTKDRFFRALSAVHKAFNIAGWILTQSL